MKTESTIKHIQRLTDRLNAEIQDKAAELTNKEFAANFRLSSTPFAFFVTFRTATMDVPSFLTLTKPRLLTWLAFCLSDEERKMIEAE